MYKQIRASENENYRFEYICSQIAKYASTSKSGYVLLDIGAGLSPFRKVAINHNWIYKSQDFGKYTPQLEEFPGLQSEAWPYPSHDYNCDILDIPGENIADLVLCTEVFEHIPNPIAAFEKVTKVIKPGGIVVISVPFASLMHQAPFWFQSGLSPYWFEYWSKELEIEIVELFVYGDYIDVMIQETLRYSRIPFPGKRILIEIFFKLVRKMTKKDVLESLGHGVIFVGRVPK